jgi:O-antigen ligase
MLGSALFLTPVYAPQGLYRPLILLFAFLAVAGMDSAERQRLLVAGLAVTTALAVVGLVQYIAFLLNLHERSRADGFFSTPNSYASALNCFLLPVTALYLRGHWPRAALSIGLLCFAALVASASRGGLLSFAAGLAFLVVVFFTRSASVGYTTRRVGMLAAGLMLCWFAVRLLPDIVPGTAVLSGAIRDFTQPSATMGRMDIYRVALELIARKPIAGWGANTFHTLFEASKSEVWGPTTFAFVHNDYLQIWLEYGLAGALLLAGIVAISLRYAYRGAGLSRGAEATAAGASLAAAFAHATVDFPLYLQYTLLLVGCMLGAQAAIRGDTLSQGTTRFAERTSAAFTPVLRGALALLALAWLAQPMLAEQASRSSMLALARADVDDAMYWASVARRLEPKGSDHYWAEAVILRERAVAANDRRYADQADSLLAQATNANAYDVNAYIARARLHRNNRTLLSNPANPDTILEWTSKALAARPVSPMTRSEQVRSLVAAGRSEEARRMLSAMLLIPEQESAGRSLAAELGLLP